MDVTALDEALLDELSEGARTPEFLVDATSEPRSEVRERLTLPWDTEGVRESTALHELRVALWTMRKCDRARIPITRRDWSHGVPPVRQ